MAKSNASAGTAAKMRLWRVLKVLLYLAGFPLLIYYITPYATSMKTQAWFVFPAVFRIPTEQIGLGLLDPGGIQGFIDQIVTSIKNIPNSPAGLLFLGWGVVVIAQIVVGLLLKKADYFWRACIVAAIAAGAALYPVLYTEKTIKPAVEDAKTAYVAGLADYGYYYEDYGSINHSPNGGALGALTSRYNISANGSGYSNMDKTPIVDAYDFLKGAEAKSLYADIYYNLDSKSDFVYAVYADGSLVTKAFDEVYEINGDGNGFVLIDDEIWLKDDVNTVTGESVKISPIYVSGSYNGGGYKLNGLYNDARVFSYEQLKKLTTIYYGLQEKYTEEEIEDALTAEIFALKSDPNSAWNQYKNTDQYYKLTHGKEAFEVIDGLDALRVDFERAKNFPITEDYTEEDKAAAVAEKLAIYEAELVNVLAYLQSEFYELDFATRLTAKGDALINDGAGYAVIKLFVDGEPSFATNDDGTDKYEGIDLNFLYFGKTAMSEEKLVSLLNTVLTGLTSSASLYKVIGDLREPLPTLLDMILGSDSSVDKTALLDDLNSVLDKIIAHDVDFYTLLSLLQGMLPDMLDQELIDTVNGLAGIPEGNPLNLTIDFILSILENIGYRYIVATELPVEFFITGSASGIPELRDYAYAKYYGTTHGSFVGATLFGGGLFGDGVGAVTMDSSGNTAYTYEELQKAYFDIDVENGLKAAVSANDVWLAAEKEIYRFAWHAPLAIFFAYFFARLERKNFLKLIGKKDKEDNYDGDDGDDGEYADEYPPQDDYGYGGYGYPPYDNGGYYGGYQNGRRN
ncbi:MAG: hypothetical protein LBN25_01270 [Christensenellaceae bacterium]|jgi:hypothetical protein|nr:hypothetical protein [Christensenellaceae bacterium]